MKNRRLPPRSRRNRKPSLPVLSMDEQLELAEDGLICSGLCDCSSVGGPHVAYFTIVDLGYGLLTIRCASPNELVRDVELMDAVLDEMEVEAREAGVHDLGNDFDSSLN